MNKQINIIAQVSILFILSFTDETVCAILPKFCDLISPTKAKSFFFEFGKKVALPELNPYYNNDGGCAGFCG